MQIVINEKELAGLKEYFVKHQFGDERYFKRADVEGWLAFQRTAVKPEHVKDVETCKNKKLGEWYHMLNLLNQKSLSDLFLVDDKSAKEVITGIGFPIFLRDAHAIERYIHFSRTIDWHISTFGNVDSGYIYDDGLLLYRKGVDEVIAMRPGQGKCGTYSDLFLLQDVLKSALISWCLMQSERADRARKYLCDWLERCVKEVRAESEANFDKAVAVSLNGSKIVHADYVVLYNIGGEFRVYKKEEMFNCKRVRCDGMARSNLEVGIFGCMPTDIAGACLTCKQKISENQSQQHFFVISDSNKKHKITCLFEMIDSEFPAGGGHVGVECV